MKEFIIIFISLFGLLDQISSADSITEATGITFKEQLGCCAVNKKVISIPVRKPSTHFLLSASSI
jgi:hypothetical protein